jgi:glycosyltransferase involved in cell wall biosynthesis
VESRCWFAVGVVDRQAGAPFEARVPQQVVLIADLIPGKGHLPFLEAAREVVRRIPDVKFIFVGRDDMNGAVQARARELGLDGCIRFAGYCADVAPWLDGSSLFVLPSAEEGAPTSILEAFAHGLPVVAYACGGIVEIVRDGVDGRVVQEISNEGMADAIVELLGDDSKRRAMGEAGRARMIGEYSLQACASRHADIWRRICGR